MKELSEEIQDVYGLIDKFTGYYPSNEKVAEYLRLLNRVYVIERSLRFLESLGVSEEDRKTIVMFKNELTNYMKVL